jgi:hypothetical protein
MFINHTTISYTTDSDPDIFIKYLYIYSTSTKFLCYWNKFNVQKQCQGLHMKQFWSHKILMSKTEAGTMNRMFAISFFMLFFRILLQLSKQEALSDHTMYHLPTAVN